MGEKKWLVPFLTGIIFLLFVGLVWQGSTLQALQGRLLDVQNGLEEADAQRQTLQMEVNRLLAEQADLQEKYEQAAAPKLPDNPIDAFYRPLLDHSATAALGYLYSKYGEAWQAELYARADQLQAKLVYRKDKNVLEEYLAAVEDEAAAVNELAWLFEARKDLPPGDSERYAYSGTGMSARVENRTARVYRDAVYNNFSEGGSGPYIFDEAAARAELMKASGIADWIIWP